MSTSPFIAVNARDVLARHGLDSFEALWAYEPDDGSDPLPRGKGWKRVIRLELEDANGHAQSSISSARTISWRGVLPGLWVSQLLRGSFEPFSILPIWAFPHWSLPFLPSAKRTGNGKRSS